MIHHKEISAVIAGVVPVVKEFVDKSLGSVNARLAAVEARSPEKGEFGAAGEPGKDADPAVVASLVTTEVEKAVANIPQPADGNSVTIDDVRPVIEELVAKIPAAKDGKDADPEVVAALVGDEVAKAVALLPKPLDGKSVTVDDVRPVIEEMVAKIPAAKDGKDADPEVVAALVGDEVAKAVAALPVPKDGRDADPALIKLLVVEQVENLPPAPAGKDGDPGRDGKDGRDGLKADECLVPDDLALEVGKAIALLAESPPIVPKAASPVAVTITERAQPNKTMKITRDKKDGSVTAEIISVPAE